MTTNKTSDSISAVVDSIQKELGKIDTRTRTIKNNLLLLLDEMIKDLDNKKNREKIIELQAEYKSLLAFDLVLEKLYQRLQELA
jgi:hypothetical protein